MPALSAVARGLLDRELARKGATQKSVARRVGISPASLCQLLKNSYGAADLGPMEDRIAKAFGAVQCPFLEREMAVTDCMGFRGRSVPTSSPTQLRHWRACQGCEIGSHFTGEEP